MEAIVASVIAAIAIIGLAYTFGIGRGQVDRYEVARAALSLAKTEMDSLAIVWAQRPSSDSLLIGYTSPARPFVYEGTTRGSAGWQIAAYSSPTAPSVSMRRATVTVTWVSGSLSDSLRLDRLFPMP